MTTKMTLTTDAAMMVPSIRLLQKTVYSASK